MGDSDGLQGSVTTPWDLTKNTFELFAAAGVGVGGLRMNQSIPSVLLQSLVMKTVAWRVFDDGAWRQIFRGAGSGGIIYAIMRASDARLSLDHVQ